MDIKMPKNVEYIINTLYENEYEGFIVGGCVRDLLLNRTPKDWDITTNAKPKDIIKIFKKTIPTGIKHGTITVMMEDEGYEVTTYRIDGEYSDSRRPDSVGFTNDIIKDLSRRDFRMNAIAYNHKNGFIDPFNGMSDIENKSIQTVGKPKDRFEEDGLRMIRAIRFRSQLGFDIEPYIYYAIEGNVDLIKNISKERIQMELNKMLLSDYPYFLNLLHQIGMLKEMHPELTKLTMTSQNNPYHVHDVLYHTIYTIRNIDNKLHLKLAAMLHDIGKKETKTTDENGVDHFYNHSSKSIEIANRILKDLRYDNKTIHKVLKLIKYHDREVNSNHKSVRKFLNQLGDYDAFKDWLELRWSDISAQNPRYLKNRAIELTKIQMIAEEVIKQRNPLNINDLKIKGNDLMELGYVGKEIGDKLKELLRLVIDEPCLNNYEDLYKISSNK